MSTQNSKLKTQNYTDWHCHLLPGIDDGPAEITESLAIAEILMKSGFSEVYCTPHCLQGGYDATSAEVRDAVKSLQGRLDSEGISLTLHPGREYYLDEYFPEHLADPLLLGDTRNLLIEIPGYQDPEYVRQIFYRVKMKGYIPVVAHPERCPLLSPPRDTVCFKDQFTGRNLLLQKLACFYRSLLPRGTRERRASTHETDSDDSGPKTQTSKLTEYLIEIGAKLQGNIGSLVGTYDEPTRSRAQRYLQAGQYHFFGSDAHTSTSLEEWLAEGLALLRAHESVSRQPVMTRSTEITTTRKISFLPHEASPISEPA
jgi:protein-tyrosine phosphatase